MKRVISILLTAVMAMSIMAVPAFAAENSISGTDAAGLTIYVKGHEDINKEPKPLSEAPKMDYVKTIEGVTFSNYIRHTERDSKDETNKAIKVCQVYVGLDASMRTNTDKSEFMYFPVGRFNCISSQVIKKYGTSLATSDLNSIKTNTPYLEDYYLNAKDWLDEYCIDAYAAKDRNMDGTWDGGLQWTFHKDPNKVGIVSGNTPGSYKVSYNIRVNQGDKVTYFQVFVTDATNYSGERVTETTPITPAPSTDPVTVAPAKEATAQPTTSPIYINNVKTNFEAYNINGNNYFKLRDVALALRGTQKQFEVGWDGEKNAISLSSKTPYSGKAGTVSTSKQQRKASRTNSAIYVDGVKKDFTAYQINGNNFFKLRDLGQTFDFNVGWDSATQSVTIDTTKTYK
ncbi:MAG: hypothetical protein IKT74_08555 [Bacteroidales bacterium]|nr:hypothetical protein [Bacteroidales bacterium]